jgi:spore maturation protein CgeB
MKIVVAGDWHSNLHEEAVDHALISLGHETVRFSWHQYFKPSGGMGRLFTPAYRAQNRFLVGPRVARLNEDLVELCRNVRPDVLFVYRGSHIYGKTLERIRAASSGTTVVGYNNDDPLSPAYPKWMWRHFLNAIPQYDLVLAYRARNLEGFKALGAKSVRLLRSWYIPQRNRPVELSDEECARFECDVVFAGHYENDDRVRCLEEVVRRGWKLNLFGHSYGWHDALRKSAELRPFVPLQIVWGEDYNKALCGARVALCFLSKLNRDTYTRRCFEIPASGTLMLAEHTDDLAAMFKPGVEADFFRSPAELVEKLDLYLMDERLRKRVAAAGRERVVADGHDVVSRMRCVLEWISELPRRRHSSV